MTENDAVYTKDKKRLVVFVNNEAEEFKIPYGVEIIGAESFSKREKIKILTIPDTITAIESNAFERCYSLEKLEIPNSIESIKECFQEASSLKEIIIDKPKNSISGSPWGCVYGERAIKWLR